MRVGQIDPRDEAAFDAWFAVLAATDRERSPDKPGWQRAERLAWALDADGPEEHRCLVARAGDRVRGIADLRMFRRENGHLAEIDVRVLPQFRRQGVGSAIVGAAQRMAREAGRRELGGMDEVAVGGRADAVTAFARRLGFAPAQQLVRRELRLPPDADRMRSLQRQADARSAGYRLVGFTDRWPDAFIADRCELGRRMSTDVPLGEQVLDEEVWDEARVRQIEATLAAQDRAKLSVAARHEASGHLVAYSELAIPRGAPESVWQHDTLVMREHRGHGLGLAMKLSTTAALLEAYPAARIINTWNAAENAHMIAINEAMGFVVTARSTYWRKALGS
ncbi:MAG: GNAT family N-acetyltransferase [Acidimicrobiales bacterium]